MRFILLVMRVELLGFRHHPAIEGMRLFAHHLDHDGLAHFVRDHSAYHFLAPAHGLCIVPAITSSPLFRLRSRARVQSFSPAQCPCAARASSSSSPSVPY